MNLMTRYEFETFVLGAEPTLNRKAMVLTEYYLSEHYKDNPIITAVYNDFVKEHGPVEPLITSIESTEESYWIQKLAKIAAIDILTSGKVQPENMEKMTLLSESAFVECVKNATLKAHEINSQVLNVESELSQ